MSAFQCNLVIPGAAKSGTSSLHTLLDRHPAICMSRPKEPQFFSFEELYKRGAEYHNRIFQAQNSETHIFGESSQSYFVHNQAISRISECLEEPKIILLLRHPVERLLSHYRWNYKLGVESSSLKQALQERGDDTSYDFDQKVDMYRENGGYFAFSRYSKYVSAWKSSFGSEKLLTIRTEDLKKNQQGVASSCFKFLGVHDYPVEEIVSKNKTETTTRIYDDLPWYLKIPAVLFPQSIKESRAYHRIRTSIFRLLTPSTPTDFPEVVMDHIREELAEDIAFYNDISPIA